jgi:hypothetical protein
MWCITAVADADDAKYVGTIGPRRATLTAEEMVVHPERVAWRVLEDFEGEPKAWGWRVGGYEFDPIDHFCSPNWGYVYLQELDNGVWKNV